MSVWANIAGPFAEITVGEEEFAVVFNLPRELVCQTSTYFKAALNNGFNETTTQKIYLDEEDPDVFRTYAAWLFEHEIDQEPLENDTEARLFEVYILADRFGIQGLANDAVTCIASRWTSAPVDYVIAQRFLPSIPRNSCLYNLVLDNITINIRHQQRCFENFWESGDFEDYPSEVLLDLLKREHAYDVSFKWFDACMQSICRYHVHNGQYPADLCLDGIEMRRNVRPEQEGSLEQVDWKWYDFHNDKGI
ncbi:hypothetical protein D6D04_08462 [Aureobasidium pullulans]|nr:hypothetical protein D6D04_08462 [Aureobasidium pullulans]